MSSISVLTTVSQDNTELPGLLQAIARQSELPMEVIIVSSSGPVTMPLPDPGCKVYHYEILAPRNSNSASVAKNRAAAEAKGDFLVFLEPNCIPHPDFIKEIGESISLSSALIASEFESSPTAQGEYDSDGHRSPRNTLMVLDYSAFPGTAFGLRATDFARMGGFDTRYTGHGIEDIDLAFMAQKVRLPLFTGKANARVRSSWNSQQPLQEVEDLVENARHFFDKWGKWPKLDLLKKLHDAEVIELSDSDIFVNSDTSPEKIRQAFVDLQAN